jgi:cytochrome o ubiquinol oxidase subunit 2
VKNIRTVRNAPAIAAAMAVGGCSLIHAPALDPGGPIALAERNLLFAVTGLVLIVVIPVFVLTFWFVWRYRASNSTAPYTPEWSFSAPLDAAIWLVPALIVSVIGYFVWTETPRLDPYRPIAHAAAALEVEVIAEDWKWLFIYPEQNIASVNQLVFPSDRPLRLKMTSDTVMNSFYIPGLAGQIYVMAGMRTHLNLLANGPSDFTGRNTQFSGDGFPDQHFAVRAATPAEFEAWVAQARRSPDKLDAKAYGALAKPSRKVPVKFYSGVEPDLFAKIIGKYDGTSTHHEHDAAIDAPTGVQ